MGTHFNRTALIARARSGVLLGAAIALVGIVSGLVLADEALEDDVELNYLFNLRGPSTPPGDVVVVAMGEALTKVVGVAPESATASRRRAHAAAVRSLAAAGAAVIAFDLQFETAEDTASDAAFAAAMREAGNVVLVETIHRHTQSIPAAPGHASGSIIVDTPLPPAEILRDAARGYAAFQLPRTTRTDAYWAFPSSTENSTSLPVLAFHLFSLIAYEDLERAWRRAAVPGGAPALPDMRQLMAVRSSEAIAGLRRVIANNPVGVAQTLEQLDQMPMAELSPARKRVARALLALYSGDSIRYLNYYGVPRTIPTISYDVLLAESADKRSGDFIRGKAVFIGYSGGTASDQDRIRDDYATVFEDPSGVRLSGVEIAATAFANILYDNPVRRLSAGSHLALVILWGVALGLMSRVLRPAWAVPAILFVIGIYLAMAHGIFSASALALPLLIPVGVQAPLALIAGALLNYGEARREREAIKQTFGYFLPRSVVDELAKGIGPLREDSQLVHGSILSTDLEGYSAIAEHVEPRELGRVMDAYFAELFGAVKDGGGTVLDVVGDGMLAIWTSPGSEVGFRRQACHALLDTAVRLDCFKAQGMDDRVLRTRMGLHCGQFMLGNFGAMEHFEYRAVGDIVNTATRIEGLNKVLGTWRLASDVTLQGLDEFLARPVGTFLFAGKSRPLAISELIGRNVELDPQLEALCGGFAEALAAYDAGDWRGACEGFRRVLADFPNDGPASFYWRRCIGFAEQPPGGDWDPTVRLGAK